MARRHRTRARWVARYTAEEMSKKSLPRSLSFGVFCSLAERTDVLASVASWSNSGYKVASDALFELGCFEKQFKTHL